MSRGSFAPAVLLPLACAFTSCEDRRALPAFDADDVDIRLGLAGFVDPRRWNLLRIRIGNKGNDFRGGIEVRGEALDPGSGEDNVVYRADIDVAGRSTTRRELSFCVRPSGWHAVTVTLRAPGCAATFRSSVPAPQSSALRVLVVNDRQRDLEALRRFIVAELKRDVAAHATPPAVSFHSAGPRDLPEISRAYDPFDLVILDGPDLTGISTEALEALDAWTRDGGTLAAFPGPSWTGKLPDGLASLLGVAAWDPSGPRLTAAAGAETTTTAEDGSCVRAERGAGRVTTLHAAPAGRLESTAGDARLHAALRPAVARAAARGWGDKAGLASTEREIAGELAYLSSLRVPAAGAVFVGLFAYALLGVVAPAAYFRSRKRAEWAFACMLAAAAIASVGVWRFGLFSRLPAAEAVEVSVLRVHADGVRAAATTFLGMASPTPAMVSLPTLGLPQPLRSESEQRYRTDRLPIPPTEVRIGPRGALTLDSLRLHPSAMRFLRIEHEASLCALQVERGEDASGRWPMITNAGTDPIVIVLLARGTAWAWTRLGPGESTRTHPGIFKVKGMSNVFRITDLASNGPDSEILPDTDLDTVFRAVSVGLSPTQHAWKAEAPRLALAFSREATYPPIDGVPSRKAISVHVIELPPESDD